MHRRGIVIVGLFVLIGVAIRPAGGQQRPSDVKAQMQKIANAPLPQVSAVLLNRGAVAPLRDVTAALRNVPSASLLRVEPYAMNRHPLAPWTRAFAGGTGSLEPDVRHRLHDAVVIIGDPDVGSGTGFVISQSKRLIATNAHVADIYQIAGRLLVMQNENPKQMKVERIWYHPGVCRMVSQKEVVSSPDPTVGDVYAYSPDVAVLQVGGDEPLGRELELATPEEINDLFAISVAMLGFPGFDTLGLPDGGGAVQATYHEGAISRQTDFSLAADAAPPKRQYLQHTMFSFPGFSGSPMVLYNGHVVGLNNSGYEVHEESRTAELSGGIRIDCLWELLAFYDLDKEMGLSLDHEALGIQALRRPDSALAPLNKARALVEEARVAFGKQDYQTSLDKCNAAIEQCPTSPAAYRSRARVYEYYAYESGASRQDQLGFWKLAQKDLGSVADLKQSLDNELEQIAAYENCLILQNGSVSDSQLYNDLVELINKSGQYLDEPDAARAWWLLSQAEPDQKQAMSEVAMAIKLNQYFPPAWKRAAELFAAAKDSKGQAQSDKMGDTLYSITHELAFDDGLIAQKGIDDDAFKLGINRLANLCKATESKWYLPLWKLGNALVSAGDRDQGPQILEEAKQVAPEHMKRHIQRDLNLAHSTVKMNDQAILISTDR